MESVKMNIYQKLQTARVELAKVAKKKSGYNPHSKYYYFQLDDFIPQVREIFAKLNLFSFFNIFPPKVNEENGVVIVPEVAVLKIVDGENPRDAVEWSAETAEAGIRGQQAIQCLGSKHTYMRRYLWLEAMEITEPDNVDDKPPVEEPQPKAQPRMATDEQVHMILNLYEDERIEKMMQYYKVDKLGDLTEAQAVQIIKKGEKEKKVNAEAVGD